MKVAVIDTGTNSTRLLVADVTGGRIEEILRRTEITRLGRGVDDSGKLDDEARAHVSRCINDYRLITEKERVQKTLIMATSSIRDAEDGEEFMRELSTRSSFNHCILGGVEEAALSFAGATQEIIAGRVLFFDVGGGSTEVAAGKPGSPDYVKSLDMGCVRLKERFIKSDPPGTDEITAAASSIDDILATEVDRSRLEKSSAAVAVAGTVTTLAAIEMQLVRYDPEAVHGFELSRNAVERLLERFRTMTNAERSKIGTMEAGRSDVIVSGSLIVLKLMQYAELSSLTVSERDILDGAAIKLAAGGFLGL